MKKHFWSRRSFLKAAGMTARATLLHRQDGFGQTEATIQQDPAPRATASFEPADYSIRIKTSPVEIAKNRIISLTTYNGQFPGPLLRLKEGQQVTVDVHNDTDVPEQLHWHGQMVPVDVDGAAEERYAFHSRKWETPDRVHPETRRLSFLSHAQSRRRKPRRRAIRR